MSLGVFRGCKRKEKEGVRYYSSPYGSTEGTCCKLRFTQFGFLDSSKKPGIAVVFFLSVCPTQHYGTLFSQADNG